MIPTMAQEYTKMSSVVRRHQQYVSGVIKPETRMLQAVMTQTASGGVKTVTVLNHSTTFRKTQMM
jgi:hypothetical protein